ncbi:MAG TPA: class I SAM-dependent methyltransferase [Rhodanobacter sp.]|jgi:2-polyprenyl-3-methyl-5-hydroxy-6-metoxy-1,4-benzoquinol methylase
MQSLDHAARKAIAAHYAQLGHQLHARWKFANDPVYAATAALLGDSTLPLLDIGCGIGLLGQYLSAAGVRVAYTGVDHDVRKIGAAQVAARRAGLEHAQRLHCADAATLPPTHGHVALLDVLHYLPAARQRALLKTATQHLAPGGLLVIRNVLCESNWRFHATRLEEFFLAVSGWIPGGVQHYPRAHELRVPLEDAGLEVHLTPLRGRTPFNSYLIVARPLR